MAATPHIHTHTHTHTLTQSPTQETIDPGNSAENPSPPPAPRHWEGHY